MLKREPETPIERAEPMCSPAGRLSLKELPPALRQLASFNPKGETELVPLTARRQRKPTWKLGNESPE